jgi:hypothetical protein
MLCYVMCMLCSVYVVCDVMCVICIMLRNVDDVL